MMSEELKTLKDCPREEYSDYNDGEDKYISQSWLKTQAVKWVKWNDSNSHGENIGRKEFMEFFNLTEEDLK